MSFTQAVSDGFSKYAQFSGRSSRSAYWWWALAQFIVLAIAYAITLAIGSIVVYLLVGLALLLPGLAVGVRRLHDTGRSGAWYFIVIIPLLGSIALIILFCQPSDGPNQYGNGPDGASVGVSTVASGGPNFTKG